MIGVAQVSCAWARLETGLGLFLANMLGTEAQTGVAMYLSLVGSASQQSVFNAAAEARLDQRLAADVADLLKKVKFRAGERNKVVHALWGVSDSYPHGLINCQPDNFVRHVVHDTSIFMLLGKEPPPTDPPLSKPTVYVRRDFDEIVTRIDTLSGEASTLNQRVHDALERRRAIARALETQPPSDPS